ncbi:hypothetical protein B6S44_24960 [Bosea sp. Tri-44]|nr:hypothetical protein B6S44_24960 [Bosea sp. Tri-44]
MRAETGDLFEMAPNDVNVSAAVGFDYSALPAEHVEGARACAQWVRGAMAKLEADTIETMTVVGARLREQVPSAPLPSTGSDLPKTVRDCLSTIATARNEKFVDQRKLYEGMLELCRPEIEAAARSAFLANKDSDLPTEREKALIAASTAAKAIIGMAN